ncbi:MAG TPA: ATP-binding protein [Gemmatimonadaceae bacterium]|nr:ATP-binding protein [Gemmatimonadaceae bacterium]
MMPGPAASPRAPVAVITGSESTGKTTLAADLAQHFRGMFVPEYARRYADAKIDSTGIPLDATDVDPIARGQIALHDRAFRNTNRLVALDTDLVSTVVYARHYYGECPPWIEQAASERRGDLYLLCDIDVPWVAGPHRDRPHAREEIHGMFAAAVETLGAPVVVVRGSWDERFAIAAGAVATLLSRSPSGAR